MKTVGFLVALGAGGLIADGWRSFGHRPDATSTRLIDASTRWDGGRFDNPQPIVNHMGKYLKDLPNSSKWRTPEASEIPVVSDVAATLAQPPGPSPRVTWMGHSAVLIEIGGLRVLTDPIWGPVSGPWSWVGPGRYYPPVISLEALGEVDVVAISHDHYDHLDRPTIEYLASTRALFLAPLGVGAHLRYWGVLPAQVRELDWWENVEVGGVRITATPARHASGRHLFDQNRTLWCGYAIASDAHRVYFSGDTGMFPAMKEIGARLGPFDLSMVEVGAYNQGWPDWHLGPEQAALAARWVQSKALLPIHWGLFTLASHGWTEPMERVRVAGAALDLPVWSPRPGQSVTLARPPAFERWWPDRPWLTAEEDPIISSQRDGASE